jgi:hypothetical protein
MSEYEKLSLALLNQINQNIGMLTSVVLAVSPHHSELLKGFAQTHLEMSKQAKEFAEIVTNAIRRTREDESEKVTTQ